MWLVITLIATAVVSTLYFLLKDRKRLKLDLLSLMLLGTFLMVLVDHIMAFIGGGPFIEVTTDGLITSGTMLGLVMIAPIFVIWITVVSVSFNSKPGS